MSACVWPRKLISYLVDEVFYRKSIPVASFPGSRDRSLETRCECCSFHFCSTSNWRWFTLFFPSLHCFCFQRNQIKSSPIGWSQVRNITLQSSSLKNLKHCCLHIMSLIKLRPNLRHFWLSNRLMQGRVKEPEKDSWYPILQQTMPNASLSCLFRKMRLLVKLFCKFEFSQSKPGRTVIILLKYYSNNLFQVVWSFLAVVVLKIKRSFVFFLDLMRSFRGRSWEELHCF